MKVTIVTLLNAITLFSAVASARVAHFPPSTTKKQCTRKTCKAWCTRTVTATDTTTVFPTDAPVTVTGTCEAATVTVPVTVPGDEVTTTLTIPGDGEVVTVTIPTTVTLPAGETTVTVPTTVTLPGEDVTVTVPTTVTLPGEDVTSTLTIPGAGEVTTVTIPTTVTLPGEEITTTETVVTTTTEVTTQPTTTTVTETESTTEITTTTESTTEITTTTVTEPTTTTVTEPTTTTVTEPTTTTITEPTTIETTTTTTVTEPTTVETTTTTTATITEPTTISTTKTETSTTVTTATQTVQVTSAPSCNPSAAGFTNPSFESSISSNSWDLIPGPSGDIERVSVGSNNAASGSYVLRVRTGGAGTYNAEQNIYQLVRICAGSGYSWKIKFSTRRITSAGSIGYAVFLNNENTQLASGTVSNSGWNVVSTSTFSVPAGVDAAVVRVRFSYSGSSGSAKEVYVDNFVLEQD